MLVVSHLVVMLKDTRERADNQAFSRILSAVCSSVTRTLMKSPRKAPSMDAVFSAPPATAMLSDPANSCQGYQKAHARLIRIPHPPEMSVLYDRRSYRQSLFSKDCRFFCPYECRCVRRLKKLSDLLIGIEQHKKDPIATVKDNWIRLLIRECGALAGLDRREPDCQKRG